MGQGDTVACDCPLHESFVAPPRYVSGYGVRLVRNGEKPKKWLKEAKNSHAAASTIADASTPTAAATATTSNTTCTAQTQQAPKKIGGLDSYTTPYIPPAQAADDVFDSMGPPLCKPKARITLNIEKTAAATTKRVKLKNKHTTRRKRQATNVVVHDGFSQLLAAETEETMDVDN
ncbi:hypothetical protein MBM_04505 [Drepanopeziza brunnea f. sp. 'multigermtubi' MB_m1]|uniref:Uncharacterized protein n=1 Tax=Marssonina brunnea f. sp. multigermtubi (strain MB_m1) TaxID=1072389 RepID=K1X8C2_MARBU|nr:uncharacterized protein MBM_04505 [Drepanopeziza brunnea f. sp. 'multigermtubi' MB_m1]EKD16928.1 hypothetical protein MBM_04505 [Drepanopeziza brunnea f. sp. 'multigermtubi' MB_m1]